MNIVQWNWEVFALSCHINITKVGIPTIIRIAKDNLGYGVFLLRVLSFVKRIELFQYKVPTVKSHVSNKY